MGGGGGARVSVERDVVGVVQKGKEEEVLGRYMAKEVCVCGDGGGVVRKNNQAELTESVPVFIVEKY